MDRSEELSAGLDQVEAQTQERPQPEWLDEASSWRSRLAELAGAARAHGPRPGSPRRILVIGGAECVGEDLSKVPQGWATAIIAINDIGAEITEHIDHWVTLHPEHFPKWEDVNHGYVKWSRHFPVGSHRGQWTDEHVSHWGGSSGMLGARVALFLGAEQVVLAGVPMSPMPHFFGGAVWEPSGAMRKDWLRYKHKMQRVKSLSGWTRELLGAPEWADEIA